jgi:hypothetical protein
MVVGVATAAFEVVTSVAIVVTTLATVIVAVVAARVMMAHEVPRVNIVVAITQGMGMDSS